jgi:hypothetical protein
MCIKPQAERMYSINNGMQIHQLPDVQQNRTSIKKSDSYSSLDAPVKSNIGETHTEHGLLKGRDTVTPTKTLQ